METTFELYTVKAISEFMRERLERFQSKDNALSAAEAYHRLGYEVQVFHGKDIYCEYEQ
jgi:hypothetical protein